jgi:SAM-dependent methyltransferase
MPSHPLYAAVYDRMTAVSEARGFADRRRTLLSAARGRVLEIGAGTGLNLVHYPPESVDSVVALEPDSAMRRRLLRRVGAGEVHVPYEVHEAGIDEAAFPDGSFDTIVATLVLCTVPDQERAVAAIRRWLAPNGRLLFIEHVRGTGMTGRLQSAVGPLWRHAAAGCHLDRDTIAVLRRSDLAVTDCERFAMPAACVLLSTCVQGVARPRPLIDDDPVVNDKGAS